MSGIDKSSSPGAENPSLLTGRNWIENLLMRLIAKRSPKCREVVRLLSQSMEVKLPVATRIKIRLHYLICVWCYRYAEQLQTLRKIPLRCRRIWTTAVGDFTAFIKGTAEAGVARKKT